jgi:putative hydrolase of the HAD superfamily
MRYTDLSPRLSAVLFDMGNTLSHLDHAWIAASATRHGTAVSAADVERAEYAAKAGVDRLVRARAEGSDASRQKPYFETLLDALGVAPEPAGAIVAEMRTEDARSSLWRVVRPETPRVLGELVARGYTLGVVSNADGRVAGALAREGLHDRFAAIVDSHVVGVEKPDPRIFEIALEACGARPERALYVGDIYEIDVRGARAAGMDALLLDPLGDYPKVDCPRIDSLARLLDLLPPPAAARSLREA